jgi:hypothetical protein
VVGVGFFSNNNAGGSIPNIAIAILGDSSSSSSSKEGISIGDRVGYGYLRGPTVSR